MVVVNYEASLMVKKIRAEAYSKGFLSYSSHKPSSRRHYRRPRGNDILDMRSQGRDSPHGRERQEDHPLEHGVQETGSGTRGQGIL